MIRRLLWKNEVIPFQGLIYNQDKIKDIGNVVSEPYDVISPEQQNEYYKKSPHNIIRIILGKDKKDDDEHENKYNRAKNFFKKWQKQEILKETDGKHFYIYQMKYKIHGKIKILNGIIGLVKIQDYNKKLILPHEDTLKKPITDRMKLTTHCKALFESIFSVYKDKKFEIDKLMEHYIKNNKPIIKFKETKDIQHTMWIIEDEEMNNKISKSMRDKKIYIADGHHRYKTSLTYMHHRRSGKFFNNKPRSYDYILMYLTNSETNGHSILPIHRLVHDLEGVNLKNIVQNLKEYFHYEEFVFKNEKERKSQKDKWLALLKEKHEHTHTFGVIIHGIKRYFILTLKDGEAYERMYRIKRSKVWKRLDVTVLHSLFVNNLLHLSKKDIADQVNIKYVKDTDKAIEMVHKGKQQLGLFLNPTRIDEIIKIADLGEKMPQKSTYFFPKILTGFIIHPMNW